MVSIVDFKETGSVRLGDAGEENCKMVHRFLKCKPGGASSPRWEHREEDTGREMMNSCLGVLGC